MIGKSLPPETENLIENIEDTDSDFDFIEISIGEAEINIDEINIEKIQSVLDSKDFELVVHLPFRQPIATRVDYFNESVKNYFRRLLKFSKKLGASKAVVHTDIRHHLEVEENEELITNQLNGIDELGREYDIEICFENVDIGYLNGIELFKLGELISQNNLSMCFDTGHALYEKSQEEIEEFIEKYEDVISHYHLQDTREDEDLHLPIGAGEIDFKFLENAKECTFCLEIFTDDKEYMEISKRRIKQLVQN